ncbi:MAG: ketopantoate reductase family protein [Thermoproteus sp. AZ2]|uniref:Ketopantoate reductase family protein n=1 Tax=Thermoproteus sp. AZ2 TaxID=1609232 RepID=A0ACC6UZD3_9CREN
MEVAVVGLGAVGMLLTYFLNRAGLRPRAVARTRCGEYVFCWGGRCAGLDVELADSAAGADYTFLAVKAYDTSSALDKVGGTVVVVQNGIGGAEEARARGLSAYPAVLTYGVYREGCRAELRGEGELYLPKELAEVGDVLGKGGMRIRVVEDVEPIRWLKLAVNAAINPVTAILDRENAVVAEDPWARALAERLAAEAGSVAEALGIKLPADPVQEALRVARATGPNLSSMVQDIRAGRRTEVDYINGAVVSAGRRAGVPTPYNEAVYYLVKAIESRRPSARRP